MKVLSIKTHKITIQDKDLSSILDKYVTNINEDSILTITSKIISITQGRIVKITKDEDKFKLAEKEADLFLSPHLSKYNVTLTIKNNLLVATSGIDESNGNGYYILWPDHLQQTANQVRKYLAKKFNLKKIGVIITDSKTTPLRWGTSGICIAHSGFQALNDYIGKPDIFGKIMQMTKSNIADGLAVSAVLTMGEGAEQTPLAIIEDVPFVQFQDRNPTQQELNDLKISLEDDLYAPLLTSVNWQPGKKS